MKSADFLDAVRAKHGLTSDYQVHKFLGIAQSRVSMYRTGRREFDDQTCIVIADCLGESSLYVMASIQAERAKCTEVKGVWEYCAKIGKRANGAALLAFSVLLASVPESVAKAASSLQCILCKVSSRSRSAAVCVALGLLTGCAASPAEKAWQAMHLVDVAQTINGPARDACFGEGNPLTRRLIGRQPSTEAVIVWGVAIAIAHYSVDRWLARSGHADQAWVRMLRALDLGYKGFTIGHNHAEGMRPFGDNHCSWR